MSKHNVTLSRRAFWLWAGLLVVMRCALTSRQLAYVWVGGAPLDDELMFRAANAITAGQWLGSYDFLTLSKAPFFAVWLALLHALHLPYLVSGAALWCGASLLAAFALRPLWQAKAEPAARLRTLAVFAVLAYLPSSWASYTLRVYRDNIFPALCLVFFAGWAGAALRAVLYQRARLWPWLLAAGAGLACAYLDREDAGMFLLPFAAAAAGILAIAFVVKRQAKRILLLAVPFALLGAGVLTFCGLNYAHYGVFVLSDFSQGPFAAAMGAMMRVGTESTEPLLSVPQDARQKICEAVPELQPVLAHLENDADLRNSYFDKNLGDYRAGSFYWAVRRAAQAEGIYDTPQTAAAYWQAVANKLNAACDAGSLPSRTGRRTATNQPVKAAYVPATLRETVHEFAHALFFKDCAPQEMQLSLADPESAAQWTGYLHCGINNAAKAGTAEPYYSPRQQIAYGIMDGIGWLYRAFLWLALLLAIVRHLQLLPGVLRRRSCEVTVPWLLLFGLLGMALLRCAMISFVEISSFGIGASTMYLASVQPLLVLFAAAVLAGYGLPFVHKEKQ